MSKFNDGGPAYPFQEKTTEFDCAVPYERVVNTYYGLSLRDYFAGQAMANLEPAITAATADRAGQQKWIAQQAYEIADAMLKAREVRPDA